MRAALRSLLRQRRLSAGIVAILAAGIASAVLVFAVLNAVVLRPLPYRDPGRLVMLWTDDVKRGIPEEGVGLPTIDDWRAQSRAFEDFAACGRGYTATLSDQSEPERIEVGVVSSNLWSVLGVAPSLGRSFTAEEDLRGERLAVIAHGLWLRRFGGERSALGKTIEMNGQPYRVIGVMRESFQFPSRRTQAWIPLPPDGPYANLRAARGQDYFKAVGRLRPGLTLAAGAREMNEIGRRIAEANPSSDPDFAGYAVSLFPFERQYVGATLPSALWFLFGAVALVLLVSCANAAGLLLARNAARSAEWAVRAALGAGVRELAMEQLREAAILAAASGAAGALFAWLCLRAAIGVAGAQVPRLDEAAIDLPVLLFAFAAAALTAMICGPVAAWRAARTDPALALRHAGRGVSGPRRAQWGLAGAQAALAVVLLSGAGLFVRSLLRFERVEPGFDTRGAWVFTVDRSWTRDGSATAPVFWRQLLDALNETPGLRAGAVGNLMIDRNPDYSIIVEGRGSVTNEQIAVDMVTPTFFQAAGVRLREGRLLETGDYRGGSLRSAVINETMARRFWPGESAVGKRLQFSSRPDASRPWVTVVGVVADMRRLGLERRPVSEAFGPRFGSAMDLVVRATPPRPSLAADVRALIRRVDPAVPITSAAPLERLFEETRLPRRLQTALLSAFAVLTLLLAAVGIYGTLRQLAAGRRKEFGIRLALGARPADLARLMLMRAAVVAGAGAATGALAAFWLSRLAQTVLFEISPRDAWALAAAPLLMIAAALIAALSPAIAAARVDAARALGAE